MEGDLTLVESSPAGSCFELKLPVLEKDSPVAVDLPGGPRE